MFLLDTNAVSESRKLATSNVDPVFKNWIDEIDPNLLYVSVISLMELEVGILRISRRDTRQGIVLREWFDMEIKPNYEGRVLDITPDIAYTFIGTKSRTFRVTTVMPCTNAVAAIQAS